MKSLVLILVIAYCSSSLGSPTGAPDTNPKPSCMGVEMKIPADMEAITNTCINQTLISIEGYAEKFNLSSPTFDSTCLTICQFEKLGFLDSAGKVPTNTLTATIQKIFPEAALSQVSDSFNTCGKDSKGTVIKDKTGKMDCSSYKDFISCLTDSLNKICNKEN